MYVYLYVRLQMVLRACARVRACFYIYVCAHILAKVSIRGVMYLVSRCVSVLCSTCVYVMCVSDVRICAFDMCAMRAKHLVVKTHAEFDVVALAIEVEIGGHNGTPGPKNPVMHYICNVLARALLDHLEQVLRPYETMVSASLRFREEGGEHFLHVRLACQRQSRHQKSAYAVDDVGMPGYHSREISPSSEK